MGLASVSLSVRPLRAPNRKIKSVRSVRNLPGSPYPVCEDLHVFIGYTPDATVIGCSRFVLLKTSISTQHCFYQVRW